MHEVIRPSGIYEPLEKKKYDKVDAYLKIGKEEKLSHLLHPKRGARLQANEYSHTRAIMR